MVLMITIIYIWSAACQFSSKRCDLYKTIDSVLVQFLKKRKREVQLTFNIHKDLWSCIERDCLWSFTMKLCFIAPLSFFLNVLWFHVIYTWLHYGHLSLHVGDSLQCSEEIVKILNCAFQCDYYNYLTGFFSLSLSDEDSPIPPTPPPFFFFFCQMQTHK